jgi:hypothetical protein
MKPGLKQPFAERWNRYFPGAALPVVFFYTDDLGAAPLHRVTDDRHCFVDELAAVRAGSTLG